MEKETLILKEIFIPILQKDERFEESKCDSFFWNKLTIEFINFEQDKKPFYSSIYSLNLVNVEQVLNKLELLLNPFLDQLAELYVLGHSSDITQKLSKVSHYFNERVLFYSNLKKVIFLSERKKIKTELPIMFEKYSFQIDDKELYQGIRNSELNFLRSKMKVWDEELIQSNSDLQDVKFSLSSEEKLINFKEKNVNAEVISFSWVKYVVAACIVLTFGIIYFINNTDNNISQPVDSNVVTVPVKEETITPEIPSVALAEVNTVTKTTIVIESGLGFAVKENRIKITENNLRDRKQSILIAIDTYREFLNKDFSKEKLAENSMLIELETKINSLQKELELLKQRENQYIFNGKELVLFVSDKTKENAIVLYEDKYYLKRDTDLFKLNISNQPQTYDKVIDESLIDVLYSIY